MFRYLAEEIGADLSAKTNKGITIMHKAAYDNNSYILTYLKEKHDFSILELDEDLNTPLHFACDQQSEYSIQWLIAFGADVNV